MYSEYIKEVTVNSYPELTEVIHNEDIDLREGYVFRGLEDSSYDLIPSALRDEDNKLNNFIGEDFVLRERISIESAIKFEIVNEQDVPKGLNSIPVERDKSAG